MVDHKVNIEGTEYVSKELFEKVVLARVKAAALARVKAETQLDDALTSELVEANRSADYWRHRFDKSELYWHEEFCKQAERHKAEHAYLVKALERANERLCDFMHLQANPFDHRLHVPPKSYSHWGLH